MWKKLHLWKIVYVSHQLLRVGAYCVSHVTGRTACFVLLSVIYIYTAR